MQPALLDEIQILEDDMDIASERASKVRASMMLSMQKVKDRMSKNMEGDVSWTQEGSMMRTGNDKRVHYSINSIDDFVNKVQFIESKSQILATADPTFAEYKMLFEDFYEELRGLME